MSQNINRNQIVATICLYGTRATGAGYLAEKADEPKKFYGDGDPRETRSFTDAILLAIDEMAIGGGTIRVFAPGGTEYAETTRRTFCGFGNLVWRAC